jgi:hypothetical protein
MKVSDLLHKDPASYVMARICKSVMSVTNRRREGRWFKNTQIETRMKVDYLSSVCINNVEIIDVWFWDESIERLPWVEIRLLACFTKLLSGTQNRSLLLLHSLQRKNVLRFLFGPTNDWTFGKDFKKFTWMLYNWRPLLRT